MIPPAVGVVGVCVLNKGRFVGGGFRLMNGKGLRIGKRPAVEVGAVASRVSPYSLALSSRVSAWVVNLPLNRLIASCFFASTIFA